MTTSAAVEPSVDLEQAIEQLDEQIGRARADLSEWESRQREANSLLSELQSSYAEAAAEVVQGRRAPTEKLAKQIEDLREKLLGFGRVIATKREQLADLQARLQPLYAEQSRLGQLRAVAEEKEQTDCLIEEAEATLNVRDNAAKKLIEALIQLRSRKYMGEMARRAAFDGAQRLERLSHGMRP